MSGMPSMFTSGAPPAMSHSSSTPFMSQSKLVPMARSVGSGTPLLLQS